MFPYVILFGAAKYSLDAACIAIRILSTLSLTTSEVDLGRYGNMHIPGTCSNDCTVSMHIYASILVSHHCSYSKINGDNKQDVATCTIGEELRFLPQKFFLELNS